MSPITERALEGKMFIGGQWVSAQGDQTFDVTDPGTDDLIAWVADACAADGLAAVAAAENAAPGWAATAPRERGEILRRAFDLMTTHHEELAVLITREMGKSLRESRAEVTYAAEFFRWFAEEAVRLSGSFTTAPNGQSKLLTVLQPVGISLLVTPWNFPAAMATRKIAPALAAGCPVIVKPASATALTALALGEILSQAGVPAGVVNVVTTTRSAEVVDPILADARVRKLSFTGSTEVGRSLLEKCAPTVKRTSMELGGNAPFLVLADADLEVAVTSALAAKLRNIGQSCVAANRFYVHRSVHDEFVTKFAAAMAEQHVGYGLSETVDLGAMITRQARAEVLTLIDDARGRGAQLVTGGQAVGDHGAYLSPGLLVGVPADARIVEQEIFGPVAPVVAFDSVDEALALANDTIYGLVGYVQTSDVSQGLAVAEQLEVGMVGINRGVISEPAAPFGGWKQSGLGREGGHEGLLEYLETKYIGLDW